MNHALVKSVKETTSIEEVNKLLEDDNWRLAHVTSSSGGTLKFCLGKMRKSEFRSAITATRDMEVVIKPTIGEYAANHHIAFCKSIGMLIVPEQYKDIEKLRTLKQQYDDWCYQKNLIPSDKDKFFHTLYELGIIDAKHLRAMQSPWPADTMGKLTKRR